MLQHAVERPLQPGRATRTRGFFAFNSVNVEGWALHAEAEMSLLLLEGQLAVLQHRLLRTPAPSWIRVRH